MPLHEPVKGTTKLAAVAKARDAPTTGPVEYNPAANPLSLPINHSEITFGAPIDIIGPPKPNIATDKNRPEKSETNPLKIRDSQIRKTPINKDFRVPILSITTPSGYAVTI